MRRSGRWHAGGSRRPVVAVTAIRVGREAGLDYSLLDNRTAGTLQIIGARATLATRSDSFHPMELELATAELSQLASLGRTWRAGRMRFAAYAGDGETARWRGHWPLLHWAPGAAESTAIPREHPLFRRMQPRARSYDISRPELEEMFAGHRVTQLVRSNLEEPMAVVLRGPSELCTIVARHRLLVLRDWPRSLTLLARLTIDGRDPMTDGADRALEGRAILVDDELMAIIEQAVS